MDSTEDTLDANKSYSENWSAVVPKEELIALTQRFARERPQERQQKACVRFCRQHIIERLGFYSWEELHGEDITNVIRSTLASFS